MKTTKKKATRTSSPAKGNKKAPKKALKKTTAKKPAAQAKKTTAKCTKTNKARSSARRTPAKRTKKDIFEGATEIAITDNKIVVTREKSRNVQGKFEKREVREYHDKSPANLNALNRKLSSDPMKKVSVKFK